MAQAILDHFNDPRNRALVSELLALGVSPGRAQAPRAAQGTALAGKTFVLTGTLPVLTREAAMSRIESCRRQGESGSVSKKTSYVLAGAEAGLEARQSPVARRAGDRRGGAPEDVGQEKEPLNTLNG